ncbi:NAD(P)/FAD-dependent oxidoreductase [Phragmitibacter flavus]|uniref:NADH:ubiquinone reductase (non-electrogenic) n=1 Tax=Phragmitibacter flavus TaxID=2576071 RepID=A0A5R8KEW3_9BACT|nr:NAD(P)/FAD-dependent oxidoreductase [Phragmitibacter flavus]TLD70791.1 NAD(P)/FAD-dependent oxidoreductase [Phragmitibacter flavus]
MSITKKSDDALPHVVVVGAGFAGLTVVKALAGKAVKVTVIDRENHHLFQPLLYQVASAGLSPANIAQPIRSILSKQKNAEVLMATVTGIDVANRQVLAGERSIGYDHLVVATGARHSYFGHPEWEEFAPGLKTLDDALDIRRRLLEAFEKAEVTTDALERERLMTFVVVGAGPTGVEMAGAISEIARETMASDFRTLDPNQTKVILLDAADRVLPFFDPKLSEKAKDQLESLNIQVRLGVAVQGLNADGVTTASDFIHTRTVIWAAGNSASPLVKQLPGEFDRAGRIHVTPELHLKDHPEIYVIGDTAHCVGPGGAPYPGVSPVAMQQGKKVAENILARINGDPASEFSYWDRGSMATIGRHRAVADVHVMKFGGLLAWLAWVFVHLVFLMSFKNRISVFLIWVWAYFTRQQGARLITGKRGG